MATNEELSEVLNKNAQSLLDGIKFSEEEIRLREQRVRECEEELVPLMTLLLHLDPDSPLKNHETYMKILSRTKIKLIPQTKHHDFEVQLVKILPRESARTIEIIRILEERGIKIPNRQTGANLTVILEQSPFFYRIRRGYWGLTDMGYKVAEAR
jgi:hypothetical protein